MDAVSGVDIVRSDVSDFAGEVLAEVDRKLSILRSASFDHLKSILSIFKHVNTVEHSLGITATCFCMKNFTPAKIC